MITKIGVVALVCGSGFAFGQVYSGVVDSKASAAGIDASVLLETGGTLIGDYDAATNPTGTQTRPGFFGGSGNNPIATSADLAATTEAATNPGGAVTIGLDLGSLTIDFSGLTLDLLNGQTAGTDLSATLQYSTFNTINPSFIYPGGIPITLPLGQIAGISAAMVTQTGPGPGTLTPTADPNAWEFTALVSAEIAIAAEVSLPGSDPTPTPGNALPIVLPLSGVVERVSSSALRVTISAAVDPTTTPVPIDGLTLPAVPFELPTLGSDTASVILTLAPEALTIGAGFEISLVIFAEVSGCAVDLFPEGGDGQLNFFDVSTFLSAFTNGDPAADFFPAGGGDGSLNFFDVSAYLAAFEAGCP
jgi:hypothetical protein